MGELDPNLVMVVEDDEVDRYILRRKLKTIANPITLIEYPNGRDALSYLSEHIKKNGSNIPKLILVDINMPIMDGFAFAETLQTLTQTHLHLQKIKLYILSSSDNERDVQRSERINIVRGYIPKPPDAAKLEAVFMDDI